MMASEAEAIKLVGNTNPNRGTLTTTTRGTPILDGANYESKYNAGLNANVWVVWFKSVCGSSGSDDDFKCQAQDACEHVTGTSCQHQTYTCSGGGLGS